MVNPDLMVRDENGDRDVAERVPRRASHSAGTTERN